MKTMVMKGWPANTVFSSSIFIYSFSGLPSLSLYFFCYLSIYIHFLRSCFSPVRSIPIFAFSVFSVFVSPKDNDNVGLAG
jgi:hypothetical protein